MPGCSCEEAIISLPPGIFWEKTFNNLKGKEGKGAGEVTHLMKALPGMHKVPDSIHSINKLEVGVHTCNSSTHEVGMGRSEVQGNR